MLSDVPKILAAGFKKKNINKHENTTKIPNAGDTDYLEVWG